MVTAPNQSTNVEVVYVCSPDREKQLFASIGTLLASGSQIDRIIVYCIGRRPRAWRSTRDIILIEEVKPRFGNYFYGNKLYVCERPSARVVFLDADTFVLSPIDKLWANRDADIIVRPGTANRSALWNARAWGECLAIADSECDVPMYNSGVIVFQNGAQRRIGDRWSRYIDAYLHGDLPPPYPDGRMPDQWALSLAIANLHLSVAEMSSLDHAYGWEREPWDRAVVFHTGSALFQDYVRVVGASQACPW